MSAAVVSGGTEIAQKDEEAKRLAEARLSQYEKTVRRTEGLCPPVFDLTGVELLFAGRRLEDLVRKPFAVSSCVLRGVK